MNRIEQVKLLCYVGLIISSFATLSLLDLILETNPFIVIINPLIVIIIALGCLVIMSVSGLITVVNIIDGGTITEEQICVITNDYPIER